MRAGARLRHSLAVRLLSDHTAGDGDRGHGARLRVRNVARSPCTAVAHGVHGSGADLHFRGRDFGAGRSEQNRWARLVPRLHHRTDRFRVRAPSRGDHVAARCRRAFRLRRCRGCGLHRQLGRCHRGIAGAHIRRRADAAGRHLHHRQRAGAVPGPADRRRGEFVPARDGSRDAHRQRRLPDRRRAVNAPQLLAWRLPGDGRGRDWAGSFAPAPLVVAGRPGDRGRFGLRHTADLSSDLDRVSERRRDHVLRPRGPPRALVGDVANAQPLPDLRRRPVGFCRAHRPVLERQPSRALHRPAQHRPQLLGRDRAARPVRVRMAAGGRASHFLGGLEAVRFRVAPDIPRRSAGDGRDRRPRSGRRALLQERPQPLVLGSCGAGRRRPEDAENRAAVKSPAKMAKNTSDSGFWTGKRVTVTGGHGFLGRRVVSLIESLGAKVTTFGSSEYHLTKQADIARMYTDQRPEIVIHLAAKVGGIGANRDNPGSFFYENAIMGIELMEQARHHDVSKFVQVGTVCAYPKFAPIPFSEDDLWNGYPEETNAPYGLAKKMLLVQAQAYREQYGFNGIYLLPVNLYGPGDNIDLHNSHVIPALIRKCLEARDAKAASVEVWGTGSPTREFLYVDDAAHAIALATERYDKPEPVNIGSSQEISIKDLVELVVDLTGFEGQVVWDHTKPDGQPRRKLNVDRAWKEFGFRSSTAFRDGLRDTIRWYQQVMAGSRS